MIVTKKQWDWVYFISSALGVIVITLVWKLDPYKVSLGILACTFAKETGDAVAKALNSAFMFRVGFDPAGYDWKDNVRCFAGVLAGLLALFVYAIITQME